MCGRYAILLAPDAMRELFRTQNGVDYPPRYNVAPTQPILVVHMAHGRREAGLMRWGLVPGWVKDPREFSLLVNARAETMGEKPAFRTSLRHHRCVIPASGYYEWHASSDGGKQPWYIHFADGRPMALAGLYSTWVGPNGEEVDTAATITVPSNADLAAIHHRMPVILDGEAAIAAWLDTRNVTEPEAAQLALPLPEGRLAFHPVSRRVNGAGPDDPGLIEPVDLGAEPAPAPRSRSRKALPDSQLDLF